MAVEIKSGNSTDLATVDPVSKSIRVTSYNSDGVEGTREIPVELTVAPVNVVNNDIISSIDVTEYKFISLQLTGTWVGTITFEGSNDNGTFYNIVSQDATSVTSPYSTTATSIGLKKIPIMYKYFRARVTAYTSGTVTGTAYGHKEDKVLSAVGQIGVVTLAAETTKVIGTVNVVDEEHSVVSSITAADTALAAPSTTGVLLSGTPSVNSHVSLVSEAKDSTWSAEITGTLGGGTFYFEGSTSSTDGIDGYWAALSARKIGDNSSTLIRSTADAGDFTGNSAGVKYFRVRALGGVGINAQVTIRSTSGSGSVFLTEGLPTGANTIGSLDNIAKMGGTAVSMGGGVSDAGTQRVSIASDEPVALAAGSSVALAAGTNDIGTVKVRPLITINPIYKKVISATGVNSTLVQAGASNLGILHIVNGAATARFFKLYNQATAPVVGTDIPMITITLGPGASNFTLPALVGIDFSVGLAFAILLGVEDSSTTPFTVSGEVTAMLAYT